MSLALVLTAQACVKDLAKEVRRYFEEPTGLLTHEQTLRVIEQNLREMERNFRTGNYPPAYTPTEADAN